MRKWIQNKINSASRYSYCKPSIQSAVCSERGSALVMVMFVLLIMVVLGLAVMRATITDAYMTEATESDVQSLHLAQKSLDEAAALISSQMNLVGDIEPELLHTKVDAVTSGLQQLIAQGQQQLGKNVPTEGQSSSRLISVTTKRETSTRFVFTLTAEASVNKITRKLEQKVVVDSYPEFLSYALGSENNLILNGAPDITGNIYAGGELRTDHTAHYIYNGAAQSQATTYPLLDGDAYVQALGSILKSGDPINQQPQNTESSLQTALSVPVENVVIKSRQKFVQVNLDDSFIDKLADATGIARDVLKNKYNQTSSNPLDPTSKKDAAALMTSILNDSAYKSSTAFDRMDLKPIELPADATADQIDQAQKLEIAKRALVEKTLPQLSQSTIFDGDLTLDGQVFNKLLYPAKVTDPAGGAASGFNKWFIVNGNLNIINSDSTPIQIKANIITTGTVTIKGNVAMDASVYVMKPADAAAYTTVLEDAVITGLDHKEVVMMSKGSILLNRFNSFNNEQTSQLTGFFYTDAKATLYGVGSRFALNGGFFAKGDLIVNAVNGAAYANESGSQISFASPLSRGDSRFTVNYNEQVYTHQGLGLPRVNQINVSVGKLQLQPQNPSTQ